MERVFLVIRRLQSFLRVLSHIPTGGSALGRPAAGLVLASLPFSPSPSRRGLHRAKPLDYD
jgi:hypothetical protein